MPAAAITHSAPSLRHPGASNPARLHSTRPGHVLTAERTAALLPDARLAVYAGAPHGLPFTHAQRLGADILAFVRELG